MWRIFFLLIPLFLACGQNSKTEKVDYGQLNADQMVSEMELLNQQIRQNVNDPQLYYKRSKLFQLAADYQSALADIERSIKIYPDEALFFLQKADLHVQKGEYKQAETAYRRANQLDDDLLDSRLKLAEMFVYFKRTKEAFQLIDAALRIDMYNADAYFLKGLLYEASNDTGLAISSFQTAVEQNPDFFEAYFKLGSLTASQGNPMAISYYDNALRINPNDVISYYNKGLIAQELGEYNVALKTYSDLLKIDPTYKEAHFNMGYVNMFFLKQYRQGAVHFSDAIRVDPNYFQAYYNRGYCYELMGDVQKAQIDYQNALELKPDYTLAAEGMERVTF